MVLYVPGTEETDLKKIIMSLQQVAGAVSAAVSSFKTRTGAVVPAQGDYPTSLIPGTTTNDSATAGNIGEFVSSTILQGSAVSLTTSAAANITSISLTAGDWDVWANSVYLVTNTTTVSELLSSISTTSATANGVVPNYAIFSANNAVIAGGTLMSVNIPPIRFALASTTTLYLVAFALFGASTCSSFGGIYARRCR